VQIRLMQFLLEAIRRNATKIGLTMLLCLVVLYVFSTVTYMFFKDMYGFGVSISITGAGRESRFSRMRSAETLDPHILIRPMSLSLLRLSFFSL
jgi:hypothetical protein